MKFKVGVERWQYGVVEVEIPEEKWNRPTTNWNARKKLLKQAASKALAEGAEIEWFDNEYINATTGATLIKED